MPENRAYPPEGLTPPAPYTLAELRSAMENRAVVEGVAQRCDAALNLSVQLGRISAIMPREEATAPWISGANREIAVLSRVGKPICCTVESIAADAKGAPLVTVSRRQAQEQAMDAMLESLRPGSVVAGRVVRMESFGAFVDIGRGIVALLPTEFISAARIRRPEQRFRTGQRILALVKAFDRETRRVTLTHKELLGTWLENAAGFAPGDTVTGIVRSIQDYGVFIELTPNLSGLAEWKQGLAPGDSVSVYIKSIRPESRKIKLQVIRRLGRARAPSPLRYFITDGTTENWVY